MKTSEELIPKDSQVSKYQLNLSLQFAQMRKAGENVDVKFITSDGLISYGHRFLLSYWSFFWRQVLHDSDVSDEEITVIIPDYTSLEVETWLNGLYACNAPVKANKIKKRKQKLPNLDAIKPEISMELHTCSECLKTFHKFKTYYAHLRAHKPESWTVSCDKCPLKFRTNRHLLMHCAKEHGDKVKCKLCDKSYTSDSNLREHMKNVHEHLDPATLKHPCETCGKTFKSRHYLNSHLKIHNDGPFKICPHCKKSFKGRYYYQHLKTHADPSTWKYSCAFCQERFSTKYKKIEHEALIHTNQAQFQCEFCNQMFLTTARRSLHKRNCTFRFSIKWL